MSEWISVKDGLPEVTMEVLVIAPDCTIIGSALIGIYFPSERSWTVYDFAESKMNEYVTHWMPLPERPKS